MCIPYGQEATIHFLDGTTAEVKVQVAYPADLSDTQFKLGVDRLLTEPLCRICLEDESRLWRTFLYTEGEWMVDRGEGASGQEGPVLVEPGNNNNEIVTTSAISLITSDQDEWLWHNDDWSDYGITVYFTKPLGGGGTFMLDEQVVSTDAFPLRFSLAGEGPEGQRRDIRRKKLIIIWR